MNSQTFKPLDVYSGIKMPQLRRISRPAKGKRNAYRKYPWDKMSKGDVFFVPAQIGHFRTKQISDKISAAIARRSSSHLGEKYTVRWIYDENLSPQYIGVWRIK